MKNASRSTKAGPVEYTVTFKQFESIDEARAAWKEKGHNPDEVLLGILNAAQEQNAKQGPKSSILTVIAAVKKEANLTDAQITAGWQKEPWGKPIREAVAASQSTSAGYIIGAPRGATSGAGITRKAERETLDSLRQKGAEMSEEDMVVEYVRLGVPLMPSVAKVADKLVKDGRLTKSGAGYAIVAA